MSKSKKDSRPWSAKWERGQKLDGGGQSHTFLAYRKSDPSKKYILKSPKRKSDSARSRMCVEVASLAHIEHNAVAKLVDTNAVISNTDDELYLIMEFIEGPHLADAVGKTRISFEDAVSCFRSILNSLAWCHERSVVHRDIKPENIILRNGSWSDPVLIDFGIAFSDQADVDGVTEIDEAFGNRFLKLPEFESRGVNRRDPISDITSACGVFYFLLTGEHPRVLLDEAGHRPQDRPGWTGCMLSSENPGLHRRLTSFFSIAFAMPMADRWPTAISAAIALENIVTEGNSTNGESLGDRIERLKNHIQSHQNSHIASICRELFQFGHEELDRVVKKVGRALESDINLNVMARSIDENKWTSTTSVMLAAQHTVERKMYPNFVFRRQETSIILTIQEHGLKPRDVVEVLISDPEARSKITQTIEFEIGQIAENIILEMYS